MNIHAYQRQVIAYHGCDRKTFEDVLLNGARLRPSERPWDWLGRGIYFWEHGSDRANKWAKEKVTKGDIQEAAVLGAIIHLENCFDLLDTHYTSLLAQLGHNWRNPSCSQGNPFPKTNLQNLSTRSCPLESSIASC